MMKQTILMLTLLFSNIIFGQQYDGLHIEKRKVDKNNKAYSLGKELIYAVSITINDSSFFLKENKSDTFELTQNIDSCKVTEIHLTVAKPRLFQRTNKNQTEIYYSYESTPTRIYCTGMVENKLNTWVHPPRIGFFRSLETCPFPYIKLNKPVGYKWNDSMSIGKHWSNKMWGEWDDRLLLKYEYEISENEKIQTEFGEIDCMVISAKASSKIGVSKLKAYYSENYGFVKLKYTLATGIEIELNAKQIVQGPIIRDARDFFENRYDKQ